MAWEVALDLDDSNSFATSITVYVKKFVVELGAREPYQLIANDTSITLTVNNEDGRFTPANGGPYWSEEDQLTLLGKRLRIQWNSTTFVIGFVSDIRPEVYPAGAQTAKTLATIKCEGIKQLLDNTIVDLSVYENTTGDKVVADVITFAGMPPALQGSWRLGEVGSSELGLSTFIANVTDYLDAETGITTFSLLGDGEAESNGMAAIKLVTEGERGRFFVNRGGKAVWWNRHHILTLSPTGNVGDSTAHPTVSVDYRYSSKSIYNVIRVKAHPRTTVMGATLWSLSAPITIPPETTLEFEVALRDGDGKAVGAESVSTSGVTYSSGTATITATALGSRARISIENASATTTAVLTALNVTGDALQDRNTIEAVAEDGESISKFKRRELQLSIRALQTFAEVDTVAKFELQRRRLARGIIYSIDFLNKADGVANAHQLDWTIGTCLNLLMFDLDPVYVVIGERHTVELPHQIHKTRYFLELIDNNFFWKLGASTLGIGTYLAY